MRAEFVKTGTCLKLRIMIAFIAMMISVVPNVFSENIDSEDFQALKNFIFFRQTPESQLKGIQWKNNYIRRFGQEIFDNLLQRYMKTEEFSKLSEKSRKLQNSKAAQRLKIEIQHLDDQVKHYFSRARDFHRIGLMNVKNGRADNEFREEASLISLMRNVRSDKAFYNNKYLSSYKRYNRLVALYNEKYLGAIPFKTGHLRQQ